MGILDDAIREHLDLKRKQGAEGDDLERLEKEAFGPSERPGEPDSREQPITEGEAPESEVSELPSEPKSGAEPTAVDDVPSADPGWLEGFGDDELEEPGSGPPAGTDEVDRAETSAEQTRSEYPELGDTVSHPALDPDASVEAPAEAEGTAAEAPEAYEIPEAPEAAIFDQGESELKLEELDLDLELEEGEESAPGPLSEEPEPDDFTFDLPEPPAGEGAGTGGVVLDGDEEDEIEDDEEDLLEETPDFLEETPEGERLWFEQRGTPKDFDFDDD